MVLVGDLLQQLQDRVDVGVDTEERGRLGLALLLRVRHGHFASLVGEVRRLQVGLHLAPGLDVDPALRLEEGAQLPAEVARHLHAQGGRLLHVELARHLDADLIRVRNRVRVGVSRQGFGLELSRGRPSCRAWGWPCHDQRATRRYALLRLRPPRARGSRARAARAPRAVAARRGPS